MEQRFDLVFSPWNSNLHGIKYPKPIWIKKQLTEFFKLNPKATYKQAKEWIDTGTAIYLDRIKSESLIDWKESYLQYICKGIRKGIRESNDDIIQLKPYVLTENTKPPIIKMISFYLEHYTLQQCADILDSVSKRDNISNDTKIKWGQSILSIIRLLVLIYLLFI